MEASEAAEAITEGGEGGAGDDKFRSRVALLIALLAMLLAITSMGGGNATKDAFNNNIQASDTWAFYQAKNIRQTSYRLTADELESELAMHGDALKPEVRQEIEKKIKDYRDTAARYESEPDAKEPNDPTRGEGKKELSARAQDFAAKRDRAARQDPNFDFAEAFFQIAIVLASVAILANSRAVVTGALVLGALATLLMLNGFFLFFNLPL
jgi:hypothetical protein